MVALSKKLKTQKCVESQSSVSWAERTKWVNIRKGKPGNISQKSEGWCPKA